MIRPNTSGATASRPDYDQASPYYGETEHN